LLLVCALAGTAFADGERALSGDLGLATFSTVGKKVGSMQPPSLSPDIGFTAGGSYEQMLGSDFAFRAELAGGLFSGGNQKGESGTSWAALGDVGAAFRFDVARWVPYAFVGVGGVISGGGPIDRGADFVLTVGGGLDCLTSRSGSYGGELRLASFGGDVTVVTLSFRASVRWGFF
jgi:hypothetical protein